MTRSGKSSPLLFDRRMLLKGAGAGFAFATLYPLRLAAQTPFKLFPFTLGVAAGDPATDGFVIWTRLAPEPLLPRGGMGPPPIEVSWEIAADPEMTQVVRRGVAAARGEVAHSVHVEVDGLEPARDYFYRFRAGEAESPVGRARTLPAPGAEVAQLRFANAGCQSWEGGSYTAWRRIAEENFDFVFHYGDYIYEYGRVTVDRNNRPLPRTMPQGFEASCINLVDYRRRYSLYKSDPDLQAAHASCVFLPSFDDHEVTDNWASDTDPKNTPAEAFLFRRAAAFQAWYEHMPVRRALLPRGPDVLAYRPFSFGNLMDVAVLDTRQFRSKQPCGDGFKACAEANDPDRTMMGATQERWLAERLKASAGTWQVLAQQVLFAQMDWRSFPWADAAASEEPAGDLDAWDGATAARERVKAMWRDAKTANPVVLTGDAHFALALEIKDNPKDAGSRCVGVEFLATSISSGGDGSEALSNKDALHTQNPHLKFSGNERGYTRHVVTPKFWRADHRAVEKISTASAPVLTRKSLVVEAGRPGLMDA